MAETKTRAVEATVAVLLAASGVTAAIGIFEAQEHHSTIGWFTSCATTLFIAILLPLATFVLFSWIENLGNSSIEKGSRKIRKASTPQSGQYASKNRIIIPVTPETLVKDYQQHKTGVEAHSAVKRYIDKWIEVRGWLEDMYFIGKNEDHLIVTIDTENNPPKTLIWREFTVTTHFVNQSAIAYLTSLKQGDPITALGQIKEIDNIRVELYDCELPAITSAQQIETNLQQ
jgi:tRNA_anti-like